MIRDIDDVALPDFDTNLSTDRLMQVLLGESLPEIKPKKGEHHRD